MDKYFSLLNSSDDRCLNYAQYVMIGKKCRLLWKYSKIYWLDNVS